MSDAIMRVQDINVQAQTIINYVLDFLPVHII